MARRRPDVETEITRPYSMSPRCIRIDAYVTSASGRRVRVGEIEACERGPKDRGMLQIVWAGVNEDYHRQGIGTALYEAAAKAACSLGVSLASDYLDNLSPFSYGFWNKQHMNDRAAFVRIDRETAYFKIREPCKATDLSALQGYAVQPWSVEEAEKVLRFRGAPPIEIRPWGSDNRWVVVVKEQHAQRAWDALREHFGATAVSPHKSGGRYYLNFTFETTRR